MIVRTLTDRGRAYVSITQPGFGSFTLDCDYSFDYRAVESLAAIFRNALAAHDHEHVKSDTELIEKVSESLGRAKQENARLKAENERLVSVLKKIQYDMLRILAVSNYPTADNAIALIKQARRAEWAQAGMLCPHCNDFTGVPPSFIDQCMHCGKCK